MATPKGGYQFLVEEKRSFLTRSALNELLAWVKQVSNGRRRKIILLGVHIPRPIAERLIEANVNFADEVGNAHLVLGNRYHWTSIGTPLPERPANRRPISAAQLQLLFQFATNPESVNWPVRKLEAAAGISKSQAAQVRQQFLAEGLLKHKGKQYQLAPKESLPERLSAGYAQVLRPKLFLGRFRFPEKTVELFLQRLKSSPPPDVRYAITGGFAATLLERFYHGSDVTMFIESAEPRILRELRLLPDREGPVTLLRAFGEVAFGAQHDGHTIASPWLVYAELLASDDPRAHEAARELRKSFLT